MFYYFHIEKQHLNLSLILDYTDELLSQDLRIHSDSSDLALDFDLSSDECSEVAKFAAESPEFQGIYIYAVRSVLGININVGFFFDHGSVDYLAHLGSRPSFKQALKNGCQ